jgi:hypothetical protein
MLQRFLHSQCEQSIYQKIPGRVTAISNPRRALIPVQPQSRFFFCFESEGRMFFASGDGCSGNWRRRLKGDAGDDGLSAMDVEGSG